MTTTRAVIAFSLGFLMISSGHAKDQERTILTVGETVEAKGDWNSKTGMFEADDIELLPRPRRPKLRGPISAIDTAANSILVYGRWIRVTDQTQFLNHGDAPVGFSVLKIKNRIEVSCKVDSSGAWRARSVRVGKVKDSDKIKGTLTWVSGDGHGDDTVGISGLRIIVDKKTKILRTLESTEPGSRKPAPSGESRESSETRPGRSRGL